MNLTREKIEQAVGILDEKGIDLWLTFVRESSSNPDPILDLIFGSHCTWHSAFIITRKGETLVIVGSVEVPNAQEVGVYDEVAGYVGSVKPELLRAVERFDPLRIAVNYSVNSVMADGLTHGMWLTLMEYFDGTPTRTGWRARRRSWRRCGGASRPPSWKGSPRPAIWRRRSSSWSRDS